MQEIIARFDDGNEKPFYYGEEVGEIIRCKDCKFYYPNMEADGETGDCKKAQWFRRLQYPNDFCSRAERKEE